MLLLLELLVSVAGAVVLVFLVSIVAGTRLSVVGITIALVVSRIVVIVFLAVVVTVVGSRVVARVWLGVAVVFGFI